MALAASEGANRKDRWGKRERRLTEEGTEREREKPWEPEGPLTHSPSSAAALDPV